MKNLITSIACVTILLAFVIQFTQNQILYNHITSVDQSVNSFKEVAKQDGCITSSNSKWLKEKIASYLQCSQDAISISGTSKPVKRGELVSYKVTVPIKGIIGAASFWGIGANDNVMTYKVERYTTSEYIER